MTIILDIIASAVITGILVLTIFGHIGNLNQANYEKIMSTTAQANVVTFARMLEFDLLKAGYHTARPAIKYADSTCIQFSADLLNDHDTSLVQYGLTGPATSTHNPNDLMLQRQVKTQITEMSLGLVYLKFEYYDSLGHRFATPVSASRIDSIRSIHIKMLVQSAEPVYSAVSADSSYQGVFWEKTLYPKNLMKLY